MSFPGSLPELKGTTAKRDMEGEHNSIENRPETAAKKLKTSYAEPAQNRKPSDNSVEAEPDYNSDYLNTGLACKSGNITPQEGNNMPKMEATLRKLGQDAKMLLLKWIQPFGESEAFEAFCPLRLDEILKEALELEQNLTVQKECLKNRLKAVSRTLQIS